MKKDCVQLEMNFSGDTGNIFRSHIHAGEFQILVEVPVPDEPEQNDAAKKRLEDLERAILSYENHLGFAFMTGNLQDKTIAPLHFLSEHCTIERSRHLLYLNGRDKTVDETVELAGAAVREGFVNFCAVSGLPGPRWNAAETMKHRFAESVSVLEGLSRLGNADLFYGSSVTPFRYCYPDLRVQYNKLMRKINAGASFAVSQYGFDVRKLQELRWYLDSHENMVPTLARLLYLNRDSAGLLLNDKLPDVHISVDFADILRRELKEDDFAFRSQQIRRLQLQVVAARFFGYSGVQLAGIEDAEQLDMVMEQIFSAFREFQTFEDWLKAYSDFYKRNCLAPYPYLFYLFNGLLEKGPSTEQPVMNVEEVAQSSLTEKISFFMGKYFYGKADLQPSGKFSLLKKLLFQCKGCEKCRLPQTQFVCPETCPFHFAEGPCGLVRPDGSCYFDSGKECIYRKQFRLSEF